MNTLTKTTIVSAVVVALIGVTAVTAGVRNYRGLDFAAVDTNSDGFLTIEEMQAERDKRFDEMDANNDGALSGDEMKSYRGKKMGKGMRAQKMFEHMDVDRNGSISQEEFTASMEKWQGKRGKHMGKHDGKMDGKKHGYGPKGFMNRMDSDGDGMITKAEMNGKSIARMMEHLDTDNDNRISKAEADAAHRMFGKHD